VFSKAIVLSVLGASLDNHLSPMNAGCLIRSWALLKLVNQWIHTHKNTHTNTHTHKPMA